MKAPDPSHVHIARTKEWTWCSKKRFDTTPVWTPTNGLVVNCAQCVRKHSIDLYSRKWMKLTAEQRECVYEKLKIGEITADATPYRIAQELLQYIADVPSNREDPTP